MSLKHQGLIFCLLSLVLVAIYFVSPAIDQTTQRLFLIGFIVALGIPHGALDITLAKLLYQINTSGQWFIFFSVYLLLALGVFVIWWFAPLFFLASFLLISALHFATDPNKQCSILFQITYGSSIIVLPALLHSSELQVLFGFISGVEAGMLLTQWLSAIAIPFLVLSISLALLNLNKDRYASFEFLAVIGIAVCLPPLFAFTLFFCGMHSPRHIIRAYRFAKIASIKQLLGTMLIPMVLVIAGLIYSWLFLGNQPIDEYLIQVIFVLLAALTVPHMLVIERFRHS